MVRWYQFALTNREIKLTTNGEETKRKLKRGTPQGGILSPLAFNLALLNLMKRFKGGVAHPIGYADDASFVISGICQDTFIDIANALLREVFEWGNLNGLKFAPHKTEGVLFHSKKKRAKITHNLEMDRKVITPTPKCMMWFFRSYILSTLLL